MNACVHDSSAAFPVLSFSGVKKTSLLEEMCVYGERKKKFENQLAFSPYA